MRDVVEFGNVNATVRFGPRNGWGGECRCTDCGGDEGYHTSRCDCRDCIVDRGLNDDFVEAAIAQGNAQRLATLGGPAYAAVERGLSKLAEVGTPVDRQSISVHIHPSDFWPMLKDYLSDFFDGDIGDMTAALNHYETFFTLETAFGEVDAIADADIIPGTIDFHRVVGEEFIV